MGNYSEYDKLPAENFIETIAINVDDNKLSDKMFRNLIRVFLPIVERKEKED